MTTPLATLRSLGKALYFCVPRNDKLLGYWDTVADRLFKIRNSLNIQGIFRQLALFEPPIDPAMLARAAAAGLDVAAIVNGLNQPLPLVRFQFLVQKAAEIVQEVKSLGNNLLSAMEKEDGEAIAVLRPKHERAVMEMVEHVKYGAAPGGHQVEGGAIASPSRWPCNATPTTSGSSGRRRTKSKRRFRRPDDLDAESLEKMKFAMKEPEVALRDIEVDIAQDLGDSGGKIVSRHERTEITKLAEARDLNEEASGKAKDRRRAEPAARIGRRV